MTTVGAFLFSYRNGLQKVKASVVWRACASRRVFFGSWSKGCFTHVECG
jgi:hypothetical protein